MESSLALAELEGALLGACSGEDRWPARIAAAVCAGIDYAIARPDIAETLVVDSSRDVGSLSGYESLIARLAGFLQAGTPREKRLPLSTDEALVAGLVGLIGNYVRIGRTDRLAELRPDLVLLTLLPYVGFLEAQQWANQINRSDLPA